MQPTSRWGPGTNVAGRFVLQAQIGQGGMGSVWRAEHTSLKTQVALKLIDHQFADREDARERFVREARAAAAIKSPHVVQIIDFGIYEDVPFMAMELLVGESLGQRLQRDKQLSPEQTALLLAQVARAVSKAHAHSIVHRDLKPDNIFIEDHGDQEVVKVLDFGIAKMESSGADKPKTLTGDGVIIGTPWYLSPEQAKAKKDVDHRTDLWALGIIAYECLVGDLPFSKETIVDTILSICAGPLPVPSEHASVPPGFDAWFARACDRDPELRFQTAAELSAALIRVLQGATPTAEPVSSTAARDGVTTPMTAPSVPTVQPTLGGGFGSTVLALKDLKARGRRRLVLGGLSAGVVLTSVALFGWWRGMSGRSDEPGPGAASAAHAMQPVAASSAAREVAAQDSAPGAKTPAMASVDTPAGANTESAVGAESLEAQPSGSAATDTASGAGESETSAELPMATVRAPTLAASPAFGTSGAAKQAESAGGTAIATSDERRTPEAPTAATGRPPTRAPTASARSTARRPRGTERDAKLKKAAEKLDF